MAKKSKYAHLSREQIEARLEKLEKEGYGLKWEDKPEAVADLCDTHLPVLKEDKSKEIVSDPNLPTNYIIEGDNYHSLFTLNFTHKKKIDVIYIDPPYNTGNKDFIYNDMYVDKEDAYRHSKWLSFMNKRLRLAKQLLKDEGVIFISINEDEFAQLKLLCDKIYGEQNYLTTFTIKVRHENRILKGDKDFHEVTEYLLLYRKSNSYKTNKIIVDNLSIDEYIYEINELNPFPKEIVLANKKVFIFDKGEYEIKKGKPFKEGLKKISVRGTIKDGNSSGRFFMKHLSNKIGKEFGTLYKVENIGDDDYEYRYFLIPDKIKRVNGDYFQGIPFNKKDIKEVPYPNFFDFVNEFNNVGYEGGVEFRNGKKPINFIKKVIEIGTKNKSAIILDFFAGSGSTAHAVMELNEGDGGNRQFIICTNSEVGTEKENEFCKKFNINISILKDWKRDNHNEWVKWCEIFGICTSVTYPRVKKVIEGYADKEGIPSNVKYFTQTFINQVTSDNDKRELVNRSTEMLCMAENTFDIISKRTSKNDFAIFNNKEKMTAIIYEESQIEDCVNKLNQLNNGLYVIIYVFSYDHTYFVEDFENLKIKFNVKPIPEAILNVYRKINKLKRK